MSDVIIPYRFLVRAGTAAAVSALNEIPKARELIFETDTLKFKLGDGVTHYNDLDYSGIGRADLAGLSDGDVLTWDATAGNWIVGPAVSDGDKGDVTVSSSGTVWTVDNDAITYAKMQDVSATSRILGRKTAGSGDTEECTLSQVLDFIGSAAEGDIIRRGASTWDRVAGNSDPTKYFNGSTYTAPASSGGVGWVTALDLDFSAQGSQTLSTDTTYTIAGLTWTKANSANDNTAMALTNGTGLVIIPKSTSLYSGATRTAPYIRTPLSGFLPAGLQYLRTALRIYMYVSVDNIAAAGDSVELWIDNIGTSSTTASFAVGRQNARLLTETFAPSVGATNQFPAATLGTTNRVVRLDLEAGLVNGTYAAWTSAIGGSNAWPADTAMRPIARSAGANATWSDTQDVNTSLPLNLVVTAWRNGSATALSVTIRKIRVDYKAI